MSDIYVTAKFDYNGGNGALSFFKGESIKVISRLPSGWFDGICNGERGWFPSNFVQDFNETNSLSPLIKQASVNNLEKQQLPENWGFKTLSDGKVYYFNMITNETSWNANAAEQQKIEPILSIGQDMGLVFTWIGIAAHLEFKLKTLINHCRENNKHSYLPSTLNVVKTVSLMFYASSTEERNSQLLLKNEVLKMLHGKVLNSLAELILAAKLASTVWPPPDSNEALQLSSIKAIKAIKSFTCEADILELELRNLSEEDISIRMSHNNPKTSSKYDFSHSELVFELEKKILEIDNKVTNIKQLATADIKTSSVPEIVKVIQSLVMKAGSLLLLVDCLSLEHVAEELAMDFKIGRLKLLNSVTDLVLGLRQISDSMEPFCLGKSLTAVESVFQSANELLIIAKFVIEDKEDYDYGFLRKTIGINYNYLHNSENTDSSQVIAKIPRKESVPETFGAINESPIVPLIPGKRYSHPNLTRANSLPSPKGERLARRNSMVSLRPENIVKLAESLTFVKNDFSNQTNSDSRSNALELSADKLNNNVVSIPQSRLSVPEKSLVKDLAEEKSPVKDAAEESIDFTKFSLGFDEIDESEMVIENGKCISASLYGIIVKLTSHLSRDEAFINAFLLTYRTITSTSELLGLLFRRFRISCPDGLNSKETHIWNEKKLKPIRIRVFAFIKLWLESYIQDDEEDRNALDLLANFAEIDVKPHMNVSYSTLIKLVGMRRSGGMKARKPAYMSVIKEVSPPSILPKNLKKFKLYELEPLELSRQITIHMARMYVGITTNDFLAQSWNLPLAKGNIEFFSCFTQKLKNWIIYGILQVTDSKKRARAIAFFISVANCSASLNNFALCRAVLDALKSEPISRLSKSWDQLNLKYSQALQSLNDFLWTESTSAYKATLSQTRGPCIPVIEFFISELLNLKDSEESKTQSGLFNVAKLFKIADSLKDYSRFSINYVLKEVAEIQTFIEEELEKHQKSQDYLMKASEKLEM